MIIEIVINSKLKGCDSVTFLPLENLSLPTEKVMPSAFAKQYFLEIFSTIRSDL
jgi:hypothetical protein